MNIYLIIADGSGGKSTTIRALTGARARGKTAVGLSSSDKVYDFWIEIRSLQESPSNLTPKVAAKALRESGCEFAIIALRLHDYNNRPCAKKYIEYFKNEGFNIVGSAEIGGKFAKLNSLGLTSRVKLLPQNPNNAANQRAAKLREAWKIA